MRCDIVSAGGQPSNIAPQHVFDTVTLPHDSFISSSLPLYQQRSPSPGSNKPMVHPETPASAMEGLSTQNQLLSTRVKELEMINDLFRGRVSELEAGESKARREAQAKTQEMKHLQAQSKTPATTQLQAELADKKRQLAEATDHIELLEEQLEEDTRTRKRVKPNGAVWNAGGAQSPLAQRQD